ncbi:MAG: TrbC/VirB2 family protein [Bdellovibrionales bacterium]|nr:TrbC/VirB2 family protein [Bdellovibrionales bacterium]
MKIDKNLILIFGLLMIAFLPEIVLAQSFGASGFENKVNNLTSKLISIVLPAFSIIGLIYAAMLAATGDESAKPRMTTILVTSIIGCLAPLIIRWIQSIMGV